MNQMVKERVKYKKEKYFPDLVIRVSKKKTKKFDAIFTYKGKKRIVSFGYKGMSDYTQHKDDNRRKRFRDRFRNEMKEGRIAHKYPLSPLYWSWHILW